MPPDSYDLFRQEIRYWWAKYFGMKRVWVGGLAVVLFGLGCNGGGTADDPSAPANIKKKDKPVAAAPGSNAAGGSQYAAVQKIFTEKCVSCHGDAKPKAGISLTSYAGVMKGGTEGAVVKAGDPAGSVLVEALRGQNGKKQMPMKSPPLAEDQIKAIEAWIKSGAKES